MNTFIKKHEKEISGFVSKNEYGLLLAFFRENNVSPAIATDFYKRFKKGLNEDSTYYWTSEMPHFYLKELLESNQKIDFLVAYFKKGENCNDELNKHLLAIAQEDFCTYFKFGKAFEHDTFWKSFKHIAEERPELQKMVNALKIVMKVQSAIDKEWEKDKHYFAQYPFHELLLGIVLYYAKLKHNPKFRENKSLQTKYEMAIVDALNLIIPLFKGQKPNEAQSLINKELQIEFKRYEPPHPTLGKEGLILPLEKKYILIEELLEKLMERKRKSRLLDLYLCGYADIENTILNPAKLLMNEQYRRFTRNNKKMEIEEVYFVGDKVFEPKNMNEIITETIKFKKENAMKVMNYYGIPDIMSVDGHFVKLDNLFNLLNTFSWWKGPPRRILFKGLPPIIMNKGSEAFINLFGDNESVTVFDETTLISNLSAFFKWSESEARELLAFLTFDIGKDEPLKNWLSRPFLKHHHQLFWIGSLLSDRRWENLFHNRLKQDGEDDKLTTTLSGNFEEKVEQVFKNKSFKTASGLKYKSSNGENGDFDVLAYKDNCLFVCEAKFGMKSDEFAHAKYTELMRLENSAAEQLVKAEFNIKEKWANISQALNLGRDVPYDSLEIMPIIVTDHFEGDLQLYKGSYRKVSLLELDVILNNKKKALLESYIELTKHTNSSNPSVNQRNTESVNWDLWDGRNDISASKVVEIIDKNLIWKDLYSDSDIQNDNCDLPY